MKKYYTVYEIEFIGDMLELNIISVETEIKKVYNLVDTKNFTVNYELESELRQDFLYIEKKDGSRVPNRKIKIEHLNYNFLVISEFDKID